MGFPMEKKKIVCSKFNPMTQGGAGWLLGGFMVLR